MSSRKSNGPWVHWPAIVVGWVNLFEKEPLSKVSSIRNTNFIVETIKTIFKSSGSEDRSFKNGDDLAVKFIKEYFPEIIKEKKFNMKNEDDVLILVSLLMYSTCIKYKIEEFVSKTCTINLDDHQEEILKKFFELMLNTENGQFTRKNIIEIIQQCFGPEPVPDGRASLSPSQKNCLKEFLGSPMQEKFTKNKEVNNVLHLNKLLQEENAELLTERDFLAKQNQKLDASVQKLQTQLNEKSQENSSLKEELKQYEEKGTRSETRNQIEKKLYEEIHQLQKELKDMQLDNDNLHRESAKYIKLNNDLKQALKEREDDQVEHMKLIDELQVKMGELELEKKALETSVKDLNQIIEQHDEEAPVKELSISGPRMGENLGQVLLDLELKEKEKEIEQLQNKLMSLELVSKEKEEEVSRLEENVKELQDELQSKSSIIENTTSILGEVRDKLKVCEAELVRKTDQVEELEAKNEVMQQNLNESLAQHKELEVKMVDSLKNVSQLKSTIAEQENLMEQMKKSIENLLEEKNDYQMKNSFQAEQIRQHEVSKKNLHDELQSKCLLVENTKIALIELHDKLKVCEEELEAETNKAEELRLKFEQDLSESLALNKELESQLDGALQNNAQLSYASADKENQIEQMKKLIENLLEEKNEYQIKNAHQAELIRKHEATEKILQDEFHSKCLMVENKTTIVNELNNQLKVCEAELKSQIGQVKKWKTKCENVEHDLSVSCAKHKELEVELTNSFSNIAQLDSTIADKDGQIEEMKNMIETLSEEKKNFELRIAHQAEEVKENKETIKKLHDELQSKCLSVENITSALDELKNQLKVCENELQRQSGLVKELKTKNELIEHDLSTTLVKNNEQDVQLADSLKNITHLNTVISDRDSHIVHIEKLMETILEEKKDYELKNAHQDGEIKQLEISKKDLENKLDSKCREFEELNHLTFGLQQQFCFLKETNTTLKEESSHALARLEELESQLCESNEKLKCEIQEKDAQLLQLQESILSLEFDKKEMKLQLEKQVTSLKTKVTNLEEKIEAKEAECAALNKEIEYVNSVMVSLQSEYNMLDEKNKELTSQMSSVSAGAAHLENIIQEDNFKIDLQERTIKKLECSVMEKDDNITKLNEEIASLKIVREEAKALMEKEAELTAQLTIMKKQLENHDPQLKEAYTKLLDDYQRLSDEHDELKIQLDKVRAVVRAEYDEILKKMKTHMKSTCTRALEEKDDKHSKEMRVLQETVKAHQDHNSQLSTNLWDTSDKLLITRNENEELKKENEDLKKTVMELKRMLHINQSVPDGLQRTRSHDQLGSRSSLHSQKGLRMVEEETLTVSRRQSIRTVPSGIGIKLLPSGKVFPSEDEAEEMFNNDCLADLKAGRCQIATDPDRVSTLMYRNSMCPPHLKSSYPAETQFLPVDIMHEDDIKGRAVGDDAKLLPDKRKKDRSQTMELRNVAASPRTALREVNDENRKPSTPSRLFSNIFSARQRRNENVPSTPDRRRLSFFGKLVKKEPAE